MCSKEYCEHLHALLDSGQEVEFLRQLNQFSFGSKRGRSDSESEDSESEDERENSTVGGKLLEHAARAGLARAAAALVAAGVEHDGDEPPLVTAARLGHDAVLQALLHAPPCGGKRRPLLDVDSCDAQGDTALHHASRAGRARAVALLLHAGADPGRRNHHGAFALAAAEASELLHFSMRNKRAQGQDFELEMDFGPLVPVIENIDDCQTHHPRITPLHSEMLILERLASAKHLHSELKHPIIGVFLDLKLRSMGTLAYFNTRLFTIYTFTVIFFSCYDIYLSTNNPIILSNPRIFSSCRLNYDNVTSWRKHFQPICEDNFIYDPPFYSFLGVLIFSCGIVLAMYKYQRCRMLDSITLVSLTLWYFNLVFIAIRILTNYLTLPSHFFGYVPAVLSSFILMEEFQQLPRFSYSLNLFKIVLKKANKFVTPYCSFVIGIFMSFYVMYLIVYIFNYDKNLSRFQRLTETFKSLIIPFFLVVDAIDLKTRILGAKIFISVVVLLGFVAFNSMWAVATSNNDKIKKKLALRVMGSKISFIKESEKLIIGVHNFLMHLPCMPSCVLHFFCSAILFRPDNNDRTCILTLKYSTKTLKIKLPSGYEHHLTFELSETIMKVLTTQNLTSENLSHKVVTHDVLENELFDLEKDINDSLHEQLNKLQIFIKEQTSLLDNRIKNVDTTVRLFVRSTNSYNHPGENTEGEFKVWKRQMHTRSYSLTENIKNSHLKLDSGIARMEQTLSKIVFRLDDILSYNMR